VLIERCIAYELERWDERRDRRAGA
jgi:hypothetical protein